MAHLWHKKASVGECWTSHRDTAATELTSDVVQEGKQGRRDINTRVIQSVSASIPLGGPDNGQRTATHMT